MVDDEMLTLNLFCFAAAETPPVSYDYYMVLECSYETKICGGVMWTFPASDRVVKPIALMMHYAVHV